MKKTEPKYYPPVENLLDLIYEHYTENNPVEKNTVAGKAAKAKEKKKERTGEVAERAGWHGSIGRGLRWSDTSLGKDHGPAGECVLCLGEDSVRGRSESWDTAHDGSV